MEPAMLLSVLTVTQLELAVGMRRGPSKLAAKLWQGAEPVLLPAKHRALQQCLLTAIQPHMLPTFCMQFMEQYQDTFVLNDARSTALWTEYVESVLKLQASEDVKKEKKVSRRRAKKKKRPVVPLVESYDTPLDQPLLPLPELYETPPDQLTGKTGQTVEPTADIRRIRNNKRKLSSRLLTKRVYNAHTTATSTSSVLASAVSRRQGELDLSAEHVVPLGRRARFRSRNRHNSHKAKTRARELFVRPTTAK